MGPGQKRAASRKNMMMETSHTFLLEMVIHCSQGGSWRGSESETRRRELKDFGRREQKDSKKGLEGPLPQVPVIAGTLVLVQERWIPVMIITALVFLTITGIIIILMEFSRVLRTTSRFSNKVVPVTRMELLIVLCVA